MFPGLMAVKSNLFALPVLEGDGEQGLLQPRCPGSHCGERTGILPAHPHREQGFVAMRGGMSTAPGVPVSSCGVPASLGYSASLDTSGAPSTPRLSPSIQPVLLSTWIYPAYLQTPHQAASLLPQLAFIPIILHSLPAEPALPHLKSCANSPCITFPGLPGKGCTVCRARSGPGERRRCRPRAPATWAHGCSPAG